MNNIAIIPARGGSKRIFKKNIREFYGKPIIAYSIEKAINSNLFKKVVVSTDDKDISKVARSYNAYVIKRSKKLSDDFTPTIDVIKNVLECLENKGEFFNYVCCIYATSPFIQIKYLREGYDLLISQPVNYVIPTIKHNSCIFRSLIKKESGNIEMLWKENFVKRTQDFEDTYYDAAQFYWGTRNSFLDKKSFFNNQTLPIVLPNYFACDIDTEEDWIKAELLYETLIRNNLL